MQDEQLKSLNQEKKKKEKKSENTNQDFFIVRAVFCCFSSVYLTGGWNPVRLVNHLCKLIAIEAVCYQQKPSRAP